MRGAPQHAVRTDNNREYPSVLMAERDSQPLLLAGFGIVLLLALSTMVFGLIYKERVHARMSEVATRYSTEIDLVLSMRNLVRERSLSLHRMFFTPDPFLRDEEFLHFTHMAAEFMDLRQRLEALGLNDDERAVYEQILARIRRTQPLQFGLAERMIRGDMTGVHEQLVKVDIPLEKEILGLFDQLVALERKEMG